MKHHDPNSGDWQNLNTERQVPLYRAVAALVPKGSLVLDVGCGMALLRPYVADSRYIGVEPSALAMAYALGVTIYHSTAEDHVPAFKFDRIIFCESLYYSADPVALMRKYAGHLTPDGRIIYSIYQRPDKPTLKGRLLALIGRPRMTNMRCTRLVAKLLRDEHWYVRSEQFVAIPDTGEMWLVVEVSP